jgi:cephalosporin hydroxylase
MPTPTDPKDPIAIAKMAGDPAVRAAAQAFFLHTITHRYSYNFSWLGVPIIQYPQDVMAFQEIVWLVKPRAIVETGVAHGGSLILSASLLELIGGDGVVVGVDIDIRPHNRAKIEAHPLSKRIRLVQGSSVDPGVFAEVEKLVAERRPVVVCLDSSHTHTHVLAELTLYSPLVTVGSYLVTFDTVVEDLPADASGDRPWRPGDNPKTAVHEFLKSTDRFVVDQELNQKLLLSVAPDGYLKCVK